MFDIAPSELLLVAIVALVVIGPKDLPKALRVAGYWIGKARGVARQFRSGFDEMVREAELAEMEKRWAAENERIMREHPPTPAQIADAAPAEPRTDPAPPRDGELPLEPPHADHSDAPIMVEKPVVTAAPRADAPNPDPAAS